MFRKVFFISSFFLFLFSSAFAEREDEYVEGGYVENAQEIRTKCESEYVSLADESQFLLVQGGAFRQVAEDTNSKKIGDETMDVSSLYCEAFNASISDFETKCNKVGMSAAHMKKSCRN